MARAFARASSQSLKTTSAALTAVPITMACWGYVLNATQDHTLMSLASNSVATNGFFLRAAGTTGGDPLVAAGNANASAISGSAYPTSTWFQACGRYETATVRNVFLNGTIGTASSNSQTPTPNTTSIGSRVGSTETDFLDGRVAEAAIWNVSLTQAEITSLASGVCPLAIRPASLVAYWPLYGRLSPELDLHGRFELTVNGATVIEHPRLLPRVWSFTVGVPSAGGPALFTQNVAGALTPAAAIRETVTVVKSGGATPPGGVVRLAADRLSGSLASAGKAVEQAQKRLSGGLTPAGALTRVKVAVLTLTGALTPAGALVRRTLKMLAGGLTPAAVLRFFVSRLL